MSPKITAITAAGLTAMGLSWAATPGVAESPGEPPATVEPGSAPSEAPTVPPNPAANEPEAKPTVLLLSNGHVLQGEVLEDATGYFLRHRIGIKHYARSQVVGAFANLEEAYQFKVSRLPEQDADEQMKLAVWCLEQKMSDQAREHLNQVLELSPKNPRARAMLFQLNASSAPPSDPAVSQTSGTMNTLDPAEPRELSITAIRNLDREREVSGPPIIFDLPDPIAYRRYQEFGRSVHPELQRHCARCHNADSYGGDFRLIFARTRRDLQNETLIRTNLDAVLRLVNPNNLARSELLSVSALTHPPDGRPVLGGPNHPSYRVLLDWVNSLTDPTQAPTAHASAPNQAFQESAGPVEAFAAGRAGPTGPGGPEPIPGQGPTFAPPPQALGGISGQFEATDPRVPAGTQFPNPSDYRVTPTAVGPRVMPNQPPPMPEPEPQVAPQAPNPVTQAPTGAPNASAATAAATMAPGQPGQAGSLVQMPDGQTGMVLPDGQVVPFVGADSRKDQAAMAPPAEPGAPAEVPEKQEDAPASKISQDALQNFLLNRGSAR